MLPKQIAGFSVLFVTLCCVLPTESAINEKTTLGCHRREYTYKATKTDFSGKQCWDYIRVYSCWGRCDSYEIADWRFPYKLSFHPVCMHEEIQVRSIILRHCDDDVSADLKEYEYVEASTCSCLLCNTSTASCEAPHFHHLFGSHSSSPDLTAFHADPSYLAAEASLSD